MPFSLITLEDDLPHKWAVLKANCNLSDDSDLLVQHIVEFVRRSYGEEKIIALAEELFSEEIDGGTFNLSHLRDAIRSSLPNPDEEKSSKKPQHLTNYRSETGEMVAKAALAHVYQFMYPAAPQEGKLNQDQPVLGFDGWGFLRLSSTEFAFVLVQVKTTDQDKCPPDEADKLATECKNGVKGLSKLARALCAVVRLLIETELQLAVLRMLEIIGKGSLPTINVAPAINRGKSSGDIKDMAPIRAAQADYAPAVSWGVSVSIGAPLTDFGSVVMQRARSAV